MSQEATLFATALNHHSSVNPGMVLGTRRLHPADKEPVSSDGESVHSNFASFIYGERVFRLVQNVSGGTLNKDSLVQIDDLIVATVTLTTNTNAAKLVRASGSFVTDLIQRGDIAYILDDNGGAGAAPEGEIGIVKAVTALTIDLVTALTAAATASDTVNFLRPWTIKASAAGAHRLCGIPMSNIATGEYGWIQTRGLYPNADVVAAGTAIVTGAPLYPGAALLTPTAPALTAGSPNVLTAGTDYRPTAFAMHAMSSDTVRRKALVYLQGE